MKIEIWEVTALDNLNNTVIDNASDVKVESILEHDEDGITELEGFKLEYNRDGQKHVEKIYSKNVVFRFKENYLKIDIHDY